MADEQGFRGQLDPTVLEAERRALAMLRALLDGGDGVAAPLNFGPLDTIMDELYELDGDALTDVVMSLAQLAFWFGAELHGVDRFGDVLTAREVDRAGRAERSAAGAGYGPTLTAVDVPEAGR